VARLEVHDADQEDRVALEAAGRIGRMFGWTVEEIFGAAPLRFERSALATARFKGPSARFEKRESAYVVYVHLLAMSVLQGSRGLHMREIPTSSAEFRESVLSEYGAMSFESALNHVWDVGVPVLPLNDPAVFHGACWRVEGRNIIVLKQRTLSASRWLFDLLHEVWHVAQNPKERELSVLESDVSSNERRDSVEEREASQFAGDVLLGGRAEELAELCVEDAKGQLEWLKAAIPRVASREGVSIDCLANYMAFRLSLQGENWWGAANNLQDLSVNPWRVARDRLLTKIDLGRINEAEQTLLVQAMIVEDCDPNA
jgi:Zn-dependent peptidase ImmA (M78 family)